MNTPAMQKIREKLQEAIGGYYQRQLDCHDVVRAAQEALALLNAIEKDLK